MRDWLLSDVPTAETLARLAPGVTPEMAAAVSKISRLQDLMVMAAKCSVVTRFRNTIGLPGRLSVRLQPNHPTDDARGIAASILDGLLLGAGDAVIGINPATDSPERAHALLSMLDEIRLKLDIPTQSCVLAHVTTTLALIRRGAPVDLVFQSIAGSEAANRSFGINLALLAEARAAALALGRGSIGDNVMYFETGQGSALSADAHHGVDQQTLEARAYAVARAFEPLLVNSVVGFIGPEYLFDGKQIIRAGLEDHFCGKLMGVPMGVDVCYTNHAEADQDDMDALLTLLVAAGVNFVMGVPGADDIMLGYQSTSFHDALAMRELLGRRPAPEFEAWLRRQGLIDERGPGPPARHAGSISRAAAGVMDGHREPQETTQRRLRRRPSRASSGRTTCGRRCASSRPRASGWRAAAHRSPPSRCWISAWPMPARATPCTSRWIRPGCVADLAELGLPVLTVCEPGGGPAALPDAARSRPPARGGRRGGAGAIRQAASTISHSSSPTACRRAPCRAMPRRCWRKHCPRCATEGWRIAPLVIARHGRVAIGDAIAAALRADIVAVLIGERPGLSAPDSMGAYLTWQPGPQTTDADRNCISNIRPEGVGYADAAFKLLHLLRAMRSHRLSGVRLKDDSDRLLIRDQ